MNEAYPMMTASQNIKATPVDPPMLNVVDAMKELDGTVNMVCEIMAQIESRLVTVLSDARPVPAVHAKAGSCAVAGGVLNNEYKLRCVYEQANELLARLQV